MTEVAGNKATPRFLRCIGIDYSGAQTPEASLTGLRIYQAQDDGLSSEILPPPGSRKYWSRRGIAEWLVDTLKDGLPTIVGIDHGFSMPLAYFERYHLKKDWVSFLDDFCRHWPTDSPSVYVDFIREGILGNGANRTGERNWRRYTEIAAGSAKSVFHFDVQGSVAKSTHAGLPWLRFIRKRLPQVHFWPFDGWQPAQQATVIVEAYPRLCSAAYNTEDRTPDQHDAYSVARWLSEATASGEIDALLQPLLKQDMARAAAVEGWILGAAWSTQDTTEKRWDVSKSATKGRTTQIGFINRNNQEVIRRTKLPGNDHNQTVYELLCRKCANTYGANGSDIFQRRCPACDRGAAGLSID